ncbi:MAG: hypothetical protein C5B47_03035 [Verrucomicrobia bacterium]|nr:MAG: hypothetical protein C5B47_03035 [Verrucomicrobiota bacterium]
MNTNFPPKQQVAQSYKNHVPLGKDDSRKSEDAHSSKDIKQATPNLSKSISRVYTADLESKNENRYENSAPLREVHFGKLKNANFGKDIKEDTRILAFSIRKTFLPTTETDKSVGEAIDKMVSEWKERADKVSQDELKQWPKDNIIFFGEVMAHCQFKKNSELADKFAAALEHVMTAKNQDSEPCPLENVTRLLYIHGRMPLGKTNNWQGSQKESLNKMLCTIEGALHKILNGTETYHIKFLSDISNTLFHLDRWRSRDLNHQKNLTDAWISAMAGEIKSQSVEQLQSSPNHTELFITRSLGVLQKEENKNLENVGEAIAKLKQLDQIDGQASAFQTRKQRLSHSEESFSDWGEDSFPEQTKMSVQTPTDRVEMLRREWMHRDVPDSWEDSALD